MKRRSIKAAALLTVLAVLVSFAGCSAPLPAQTGAAVRDLMKGISASKQIADPRALEKNISKASDFALKLLTTCSEKGKNTLVSPLSVLAALSMTANGADKNTLAQMEAVLGMSKDELNEFYLSYSQVLAEKKNGKLSLANSIWFRDDDDFAVSKDFLQTNADYFGAELYKVKFDGSDAAKNAINSWVKDKTDGMIPEILDKVPDNVIMYLINALAFDAEWQEVYNERQVSEGIFANADGTKKTVEFMYNQESQYLETPDAVGFIKNYKGGDYAFAALLPKEGCTVEDVVAALDGEALAALLASPMDAPVETAIPKFEAEYSADLSKALAAMGMPEAFDPDKADFSKMGTGSDDIYIGRVLHKTYMAVNEKGTRAGAATAVEMLTKGALIMDTMQVYLDRPFVYMLIDRTTNLPIFIGQMNEL